MWLVFTQHFWITYSCQEQHDVYVKDFSFSKDDNGVDFIGAAFAKIEESVVQQEMFVVQDVQFSY